MFILCSVIIRKYRHFSSILLASRLPIQRYNISSSSRRVVVAVVKCSLVTEDGKRRDSRDIEVFDESKGSRGEVNRCCNRGQSWTRIWRIVVCVFVCVAIKQLDYLHILCSIRTFATGKLYLSGNSKRSYHVKTIACYATPSAITADESEALNLAIYLFLFNWLIRQ